MMRTHKRRNKHTYTGSKPRGTLCLEVIHGSLRVPITKTVWVPLKQTERLAIPGWFSCGANSRSLMQTKQLY